MDAPNWPVCPHLGISGILEIMAALKSQVVGYLRQLAAELEPFMSPKAPGTRVWNGMAYGESTLREGDPYALAWWSTLTAIADTLQRQNEPLTSSQVDYLKRRFSGGMGSFNDFRLDATVHGSTAVAANGRLDTTIHSLVSCLTFE